MAQDKRFIKTYTQGGFAGNLMQIWVDKQTGVNYLYAASGYSGGLTGAFKPGRHSGDHPRAQPV